MYRELGRQRIMFERWLRDAFAAAAVAFIVLLLLL